ncbi:MAG: hypothetical protein GWP08_01170 [Nitrospiraceae bacterium]|nr:hypothetical protein [Nitrospiraceae bacterium]
MTQAYRRLKADLHVHSGDDPYDGISYSSEMLIAAASQLNFQVLAIACHRKLVHNERLAAYARNRGIVLVPAVELLVEGKHVVVLNPDEAQAQATTYAELRELGRRDAAFLAPHPYFPDKTCLGKRLVEHADLFDAVEYCGLYTWGLNFNRRAVRVAKRFGLPLAGTSDTHTLPYNDSTFSWLEVAEVSVEGVVDAVRAGRVEVDTRPRTLAQFARMSYYVARETVRMWAGLRE